MKQMSRLYVWLAQATRHLSKESAAEVRSEIREHYQSHLDAAVNAGASAEEADRMAVLALGDAKVANREYRKVLLTASEARILRDSALAARLVCSRPWLKRLIIATPIILLFAALALWFSGVGPAQALLVFLTAGLLPIYTPSRGRAFRIAKWLAFAAMFSFAFGREGLAISSILLSQQFWYEWRRVSIRRKLPVAKRPKHLYL